MGKTACPGGFRKKLLTMCCDCCALQEPGTDRPPILQEPGASTAGARLAETESWRRFSHQKVSTGAAHEQEPAEQAHQNPEGKPRPLESFSGTSPDKALCHLAKKDISRTQTRLHRAGGEGEIRLETSTDSWLTAESETVFPERSNMA